MTVSRRLSRSTMLVGVALAGSMTGIIFWVGSGLLCPNDDCRVLELDRQILGELHALRRPWLDAILAAATWLGSIAVLLPISLVLAWQYRRRGQHELALLLPVAVAGAWLLAQAGKLLVVRPRPDLYPSLIAMPADPSFPSAHAFQITAFALAWLLAARARPGLAAASAAATLILVVSLSRLYLQVHFPSDVLAGMILGASWAIALRLMLGARP